MKSIRATIIELHRAGHRNCEIVRLLATSKVSKQLVSKTIKRFKETNNLDDRPRSGRPCTAMTARNIKVVRSRIRRNPQRSARKMAAELKISRSTTMRILKNVLKVKAYKTKKVQFLSDAAKKNRLVRCKNLKCRFANDEYQVVLFSDEKFFTIEQVMNKQNNRIWSSDPFCIPKSTRNITRKQGAPGVMVWAGVTADGKTPLVFINQGVKINAEVYMNQVLESVVKPWAQEHFSGRNWIFQQDSAPSHKAKKVQQWCRDEFPEIISSDEWPSYSPDLNPLDYSIWGILEAKVCSKSYNNIESLKQAIKEEWDKIRQEFVRTSIEKFPQKLDACIRANGAHFE